jgi:hypothetical protein
VWAIWKVGVESMAWTKRFVEDGGYDCMTDAIYIEDDGKLVVEVDYAKFGQLWDCAASVGTVDNAEKVASLLVAAPDLLEALKMARHYVELSASDGNSFAKVELNAIDAAIDKAEGN